MHIFLSQRCAVTPKGLGYSLRSQACPLGERSLVRHRGSLPGSVYASQARKALVVRVAEHLEEGSAGRTLDHDVRPQELQFIARGVIVECAHHELGPRESTDRDVRQD